jgi:hypothetical protein
LQQFADLLAQAAAKQQAAMDPEGDLHATVVNTFDDLAAQISLLRGTLVNAPAMDWGATWGQALHPILGPWRETHAKSRRMLQAMNAVTEAGRCLQRMHLDVLARAVDSCREKLRQADGPAIDSLRGLFDWWVAVADAAYRDAAFTDDYAEAFASAVNAASELKLAMREMDTLWPGAAMYGGAGAPAPAPAAAREASGESTNARSKPRKTTAKSTAPRKPPSAATSTAPAHKPAPKKPKGSAPKTVASAARTPRDEFDIGHIAPVRK